MEAQILDILLKMQKLQEEILTFQKGIKQDISEIIEMQIKDKKQLDARFEFVKERFNEENNKIMDLNYKLHLLKTLD